MPLLKSWFNEASLTCYARVPNRSRSSLSATSLIFDLNNVKSRQKMVASWRKSSTVAGQKQAPDSTRTLARPLRVWSPRLRRAKKLVSPRRARIVLSCKRLQLSNHYQEISGTRRYHILWATTGASALSRLGRKEGRGSDIGLGREAGQHTHHRVAGVSLFGIHSYWSFN